MTAKGWWNSHEHITENQKRKQIFRQQRRCVQGAERRELFHGTDTNTVILRGLSGKMTVNALLIGALATLLVFAIVMSNVAFSLYRPDH